MNASSSKPSHARRKCSPPHDLPTVQDRRSEAPSTKGEKIWEGFIEIRQSTSFCGYDYSQLWELMAALKQTNRPSSRNIRVPSSRPCSSKLLDRSADFQVRSGWNRPPSVGTFKPRRPREPLRTKSPRSGRKMSRLQRGEGQVRTFTNNFELHRFTPTNPAPRFRGYP